MLGLKLNHVSKRGHWHSPATNGIGNYKADILYNEFENHRFKITVTSSSFQEPMSWVSPGIGRRSHCCYLLMSVQITAPVPQAIANVDSLSVLLLKSETTVIVEYRFYLKIHFNYENLHVHGYDRCDLAQGLWYSRNQGKHPHLQIVYYKKYVDSY